MLHIALDLKDSLRGLRRDLGYAITSVCILALTIGATTTTFSIVNGVLLKPLAYRESHALVALREVVLELAGQYPVVPVNGRHFDEWRSQARTFEALAEYSLHPFQADGSRGPLVIVGKKVSSCVLDTKRRLPKAPGSPRRKYYGSCRRDSIGGISIGWGDIYGARVSGQELDLTRLGDGVYCLVSQADPEDRLLESNERNNARTTRIVLRAEALDWQPHRGCS